VVADLAKSWSVSEDRRTYTFHLDTRATFSNGHPVTADDVAYSLARHLWPKSPSVLANYLRDLIVGGSRTRANSLPAGIRVISARSLQISIIGPYSMFLMMLATPSFAIVEKLSAEGGVFVGSGPFVVEQSGEPGVMKLLARNSYTGKTPKAKTITIHTFKNPEQLAQSVESGGIDVAYGYPMQKTGLLDRRSEYVASKTNSFAYGHFFFNARSAPFTAASVRRDTAALVYQAIEKWPNREGFLEFNPTYLPKMIMPSEYYKRTLPRIDPLSYRVKWGKSFDKRPVRLAVLDTYNVPDLFAGMIHEFAAGGVNLEVRLIPSVKLRSLMQSKDYDLLFVPYIGSYGDPDGLLDPLSERSTLRLGNFETDQLSRAIASFKFMEPRSARLASYTHALMDFEGTWNVIPAFQLSLPIVHKKKIAIPDTSYRFEADLASFFWEAS
jgi:ABC-type oligopeptide transport system substrate-binding subunit